MKLIFLFIIINSSAILLAQSDKKIIPSERILEEDVKPFIDSLKQKILSDTTKFDRKDLRHINGRTKNLNSYSTLISINMIYSYRLDIVESKLVKKFTSEILNHKNIESINYIKKEDAASYNGFMHDNGWIIIFLKPKVKLDFEVGGLKYFKGRKRKGGNNFNQRKKGEIMIRT